MSLSFKPELLKLIPLGLKTQTRRPYRLEQTTWLDYGNPDLSIKEQPRRSVKDYFELDEEIWAVCQNGRIKYRVHNDYSAIYGRGKGTAYYDPASAEILSYENLCSSDFWQVTNIDWKPLRLRIAQLRFEDVRIISQSDVIAEGFQTHKEFWDVWTDFYDPHVKFLTHEHLITRPDHLYQAIVINFEIA